MRNTAERCYEGEVDLEQGLSLRVRSQGGTLVPLSEIVRVLDASRAQSIYPKRDGV